MLSCFPIAARTLRILSGRIGVDVYKPDFHSRVRDIVRDLTLVEILMTSHEEESLLLWSLRLSRTASWMRHVYFYPRRTDEFFGTLGDRRRGSERKGGLTQLFASLLDVKSLGMIATTKCRSTVVGQMTWTWSPEREGENVYRKVESRCVHPSSCDMSSAVYTPSFTCALECRGKY